MVDIRCNNSVCNNHKCRINQTFVIIPDSSKYLYALLYTAGCTKCGKHYTLIENVGFENHKDRKGNAIRGRGGLVSKFNLYTGSQADKMFNLLFEEKKAVLYEVLKQSQNLKSGFYLGYSEYGKKKRCYSNLSSLKLGRIKYNFEDIEHIKKIFVS